MFHKNLLSLPFFILVRFFQLFISPLIPNNCRYLPSCSNYALEAYNKYGVIMGNILVIRRLLKCNPFGGSGLDPVCDKHKKIFF